MGFNDDDRGQRKQAEADKRALKQLHDDLNAVLETVAGRRLLWEFLQAVGIDESPFSTNAMAQSYTTGKQDAGRWWLNLIRAVCPQREAQLRADGLFAAKQRRNQREETPHDDA